MFSVIFLFLSATLSTPTVSALTVVLWSGGDSTESNLIHMKHMEQPRSGDLVIAYCSPPSWGDHGVRSS